ncbi:hypothetical protein Tco_0285235 [Tanacetum coccineum]
MILLLHTLRDLRQVQTNVGVDVDLRRREMWIEHPEKLESVNDTYLKEQGDTNITIDSLDMSTNGEAIDQDDNDLARECLVDKLKGEIEDFKTKNKSLESSNNHFKEANNELSKTNQLMFKDLKKFQAELDWYYDVNYASKVEIDYAKAKGDLVSYKMESQKSFNEYTQKINDFNQMISEMKKKLIAHQETISIMSQEKEAQKKFHKTRVIPTTSVSRPQLKRNRLEDKVMHNNSEGKKQQVEDHHRNFKFSNNKKHCILRGLKCLMVVLCTREPKQTVNQSVATPLKRTIASKSTNQKPRSKIKKQYEKISTVKFGNDQIATILGYGDLVQGNVTIKRVYYVKGLNHNLFSVGQFFLVGDLLFHQLFKAHLSQYNVAYMVKANVTSGVMASSSLTSKFDTQLASKYDIVIGLPN